MRKNSEPAGPSIIGQPLLLTRCFSHGVPDSASRPQHARYPPKVADVNAPCFSPPMSISPPLLSKNSASAANKIKPTTIFHIPNFFSKKRPQSYDGGRRRLNRFWHHTPARASARSINESRPNNASLSRWRKYRRLWFQAGTRYPQQTSRLQ